jgi:uncharacterized membrane protein YqjE
VWTDYAIYVSTLLILLSLVGLIVVAIRNRARVVAQVVLLALLVVGLAATPLVFPERLRETGEPLNVVEVEGVL